MPARVHDYVRPERGWDRGPAGEGAWGQTWSESLLHAANGLALGSALLLATGLLLLATPWGSILCYPLMGGAVVFHAAAWWTLGQGAFRAPQDSLRAVLGAVFAASLVAFTVSFGFVLLRGAGPMFFHPILIFPFLPVIWGPVVACHAALYLVAGAATDDPAVARWTTAGASILLALAVGGSLAWTTPGLTYAPLVLLGLPGVSSLGYVLIGVGLLFALPSDILNSHSLFGRGMLQEQLAYLFAFASQLYILAGALLCALTGAGGRKSGVGNSLPQERGRQ